MPLGDFLGSLAVRDDMIRRAMPGAPASPREGTNVSHPYGIPRFEQAAPPAPAPQAAAMPTRPKRKGLRNFLGTLGDALLTGAGADPIYQPQQEREALGEALAQFVGAADPTLAAVMRDNPEMGLRLLGVRREDQRFDRTAGQDDRRIGISEGQLGLGERELDERTRANRAGEDITKRGQDISSTTDIRLQQMRQQEAAAGRAHDAALQRGDQAHAERMLRLQQDFQRQIAELTGDGGSYEETVVETPGTEARDGWFSDTPATPSSKTVTRRRLPTATAPETQGRTVTRAQLQAAAQRQGVSYEQAARIAASHGLIVR